VRRRDAEKLNSSTITAEHAESAEEINRLTEIIIGAAMVIVEVKAVNEIVPIHQ
jgi:hypothetical protein